MRGRTGVEGEEVKTGMSGVSEGGRHKCSSAEKRRKACDTSQASS